MDIKLKVKVTGGAKSLPQPRGAEKTSDKTGAHHPAVKAGTKPTVHETFRKSLLKELGR